MLWSRSDRSELLMLKGPVVNPQAALIFLADDDPDDRLMATEAAEELGLEELLVTVDDGQELLDALRSYRSPNPVLVVLDLNMPRKDGKQALAEIRKDPELRHVPVVVFTTSSSPEEVAEVYSLGVNSFITKPDSFSDLVKILHNLYSYWLETVRLPVGS